MRCETAGCRSPESNHLVLLPLSRPDGSLNTFACLECAQSSGAYCVQHQCPHQGFEDGTTACPQCIEAEVQSLRGRTDYLGALHQHVPRHITTDQFGQLVGLALPVANLRRTSPEEVVLGWVVTIAHRRGDDRMNVFAQVAVGNLGLILPGIL